MSTHTRIDIEATADYECALGDCGHRTSPCPTEMWDCCQECSIRSFEEAEGGVITWEQCGGVGATFAEADAEPNEPSCGCLHSHYDGVCPGPSEEEQSNV